MDPTATGRRAGPVKRVLADAGPIIVLAALFAAVLAAVEASLAPRIEAAARARFELAVLEVVPGGVSFEERDAAGGPFLSVADEGGRTIGWAVGRTATGFADEIVILVGFDRSGRTVLGLAILASRETPGLGSRVGESVFEERLTGRPAADLGEADAITGATISSKAVLAAVADASRGLVEALEARELEP